MSQGKNDYNLLILIKNGLDLDMYDHLCLERVLRFAKESGDKNLFQTLLTKGVDPGFGYKHTRSKEMPLIWKALTKKEVRRAHFLVSAGADIHTKLRGCSLLGYAAKHRIMDIIPLLLSAGADPLEKSGIEEKTPLRMAVQLPDGSKKK